MKLINELKRRNVFRVGIAYIVGAWLLAQAADFVLQVMGAPDIVLRYVVVLLALGLVPAVVISWVYEVTPEGVKKASEIDLQQSITHQTGKKLDVVIIGLLVVAIGLVLVQRFVPGGEPAAGPEDSGSTQAVTAPAEESPPEVPEPAVEKALPSTSIAVLPFANRSNREDDLYFTDGIHDDLLTQLAKIGGLTVISRTSVMKYRDSTQSLGEIGAELKVGTILEGGVQKVGDRVRINAQLIQVATDKHLWAETFDRELTAENVFDLQSEIARKIVNSIAVQLSPQEDQLLDAVPTQSLAAYDAYLRARSVFYGANYSRSQEEQAEPLVRQAIELDPSYADAHALLSLLYSQKYWRGIDTSEELLEQYRQSLERASALNPNSPEALRARANYLYRVDSNYAGALELLQRAVAVAPGNVDIHGDMGLALRRLGRWEESIDSFQRALELDPDNRFYQSIMLETMAFAHRWQDILDNSVPLEDAPRDEIDIQLQRANALLNLTGDLEPMVRVFERMNIEATNTYQTFGAYVHMMRRDPDKAIEVLNSPIWVDSIADDPLATTQRLSELAAAWRLKGDEARARSLDEQIVADREEIMGSNLQTRSGRGSYLAISMAQLGQSAEALKLANELVEENPYDKDAVVWGTPMYARAMVRGLTGDAEGSIADLKLVINTPTGGWTAWQLYYDPQWDFMRDNERFVELATPDNLIQ